MRWTDVDLDAAIRSLGYALPTRLGSRGSGTADLRLAGAPGPAWLSGLDADVSTALRPVGGGLSLAGTIDAGVRRGVWSLEHRLVSAPAGASLEGTLRGRLDARTNDSSIGGGARLRVADLAAVYAFAQDAGAALPEQLADAARTLAADLRVSGTAARPAAQVTLGARDVQAAGRSRLPLAPWMPRSPRPARRCASRRSRCSWGRRGCRPPVPTPGTGPPMSRSMLRPTTSPRWRARSSCRAVRAAGATARSDDRPETASTTRTRRSATAGSLRATRGSRAGPGAPWHPACGRHARRTAPLGRWHGRRTDARDVRAGRPPASRARRRRPRWRSSRGAASTRSRRIAIRRRCASIGAKLPALVPVRAARAVAHLGRDRRRNAPRERHAAAADAGLGRRDPRRARRGRQRHARRPRGAGGDRVGTGPPRRHRREPARRPQRATRGISGSLGAEPAAIRCASRPGVRCPSWWPSPDRSSRRTLALAADGTARARPDHRRDPASAPCRTAPSPSAPPGSPMAISRRPPTSSSTRAWIRRASSCGRSARLAAGDASPPMPSCPGG